MSEQEQGEHEGHGRQHSSKRGDCLTPTTTMVAVLMYAVYLGVRSLIALIG